LTINGKKDRLDRIEELLSITAMQTAENFKQLQQYRAEFQREMKVTRDEHNREMKEIRALFKKMIRRIAV
jgi:hypothetical protein